MPNLLGLTKMESDLIMQSLGFEVNFIGEFGNVIHQSPVATDSLINTSNINIILSGATPSDSSIRKGYQSIPNVSGMSMRNANHILSSLGFEVDRIGSGTVYDQFPREDEIMRMGGRVTIRGKSRSLETRTLVNLNN